MSNLILVIFDSLDLLFFPGFVTPFTAIYSIALLAVLVFFVCRLFRIIL